mmetsp:Transcript_20373/g.51287  ORF Transcript_20373/g.51287 Transcript_20373/m.51287 type:complete len:107 (-) Transcript_20373:308-628(-)
MAKGAMKKARRRAAGMEVEGGKAAAPAAAPAAMDTGDAPLAAAKTAPKNTGGVEVPLYKRGQKLKNQQKRKKAKLSKALSFTERTESRVAKLTKKNQKKTVLKALY